MKEGVKAKDSTKANKPMHPAMSKGVGRKRGENKPRWELFAYEYLKDKNSTQAAIRAGLSAKTAGSTGCRLLKDARVQAIVQQKMGEIVDDLQISVKRVLQERARLAFFDPRKLFDKEGKPIPIQELDDDTAACLQGLDVIEQYEQADGVKSCIGYLKKYKLASKNESLTALEKHLGMYKQDEVPVSPLNIIINLG